MQREVKFPKRRIPRMLVIGIVVIIVATLFAFAFAPSLRETRVARAIRFWQEPPPPEPAVPAGQLGKEVQQAEAANPSGTVTIDPNTATALGLQTAVVETKALDQSVHTTGRVAADERRITHVHTKVDGWIEKAYADFIGQEIRKGQPLFTFYSPDLVATQQEYLLALRARKNFKNSEFEVVRDSGDSLVEATRRRLLLWDLTKEQIEEIEQTGTVHKEITFYSPASGIITDRKAYPGVRITPDMDLYALADLSVVWVEADLFESDLANIHIGTHGTITLPGGDVQGSSVSFINPLIEPQTRTAKVRLELLNKGLRLKPGMFVDVNFNVTTAAQMVVPRDAVLDTGARKVVLVDNGNNTFTLREIRTGSQGRDYYTVLSGITTGEKVARNIQFLIDSETPLRQAVEQQYSSTSSTDNQQNRAPGNNNPSGTMPNMPGMEGKGGKQ